MKSQNAQILAYLQSGKKLTPIEALQKFGTLRLSARVNDLRNEGHDIKTQIINTPTHKYVAQYYVQVN
jgi:hypothetical protein